MPRPVRFIQDPDETFRYRFVNPSDPDGERGEKPYTWPHDSFVELRRNRNQGILDDMAGKLASQQIQYDAEEEKKARRAGKRYSPTSTFNARKSGLTVNLEHGILDWGGSAFITPRSLKIKGTNTPHPDAGRELTFSPENVAYLSEPLAAQIGDMLDVLWQNPGEDDEELFRLSGQGIPGPTDPGYGSGDDVLSAGAV